MWPLQSWVPDKPCGLSGMTRAAGGGEGRIYPVISNQRSFQCGLPASIRLNVFCRR
jgi:hypothetical protein